MVLDCLEQTGGRVSPLATRNLDTGLHRPEEIVPRISDRSSRAMLPNENIDKTIPVSLQGVDVMLAATIVVIRVKQSMRCPGTIRGTRDHARDLSLVEMGLSGSSVANGSDFPTFAQIAGVQ